MSRIIERTEQTATVKTEHGEAVVDLDRAAQTVAELIDEYAHEQKRGWTLGQEFFRSAFVRLTAATKFTYRG